MLEEHLSCLVSQCSFTYGPITSTYVTGELLLKVQESTYFEAGAEKDQIHKVIRSTSDHSTTSSVKTKKRTILNSYKHCEVVPCDL